MRAIERLIALLRDPQAAAGVPADAWPAILSVARGEVMLGTLAHHLAGQSLPPAIAAHLAAAARAADHARTLALWEAEMCRRALAPLGIAPILLKGTAYAAAGLSNAAGRQIGDLDILVPRDRLDEVEAALLGAGWEWVKDDAYDQAPAWAGWRRRSWPRAGIGPGMPPRPGPITATGCMSFPR